MRFIRCKTVLNPRVHSVSLMQHGKDFVVEVMYKSNAIIKVSTIKSNGTTVQAIAEAREKALLAYNETCNKLQKIDADQSLMNDIKKAA